MITTATQPYWTDHTDYTGTDLVTITTTSASPIVYTTLPSYTILGSEQDKPLRRRYTCVYCGTEYIEEKGGFIPNCKNCGAILRKCQD